MKKKILAVAVLSLSIVLIIPQHLSGPMSAYHVGWLLLRKHTDNAIWTMLSLYIGLHVQKPHYTLK
jgi:hypothetical protein